MSVVDFPGLCHLLEPRQRKWPHHAVVHFEEKGLIGQHVSIFSPVEQTPDGLPVEEVLNRRVRRLLWRISR